MTHRDRTGWLGRQDSNLGMAESKSKWFALFVNAHSEKMLKFDLNPIKRLAEISECRDASHLAVTRPALRKVEILSGVYCGPVLRHSAGAIQAANFSSVVAF
jgi:hypothetical protein